LTAAGEVRQALRGGPRGVAQGRPRYTEEVARTFPDEEQHTYSIPQEELEEFARYLEQESLVGTDTPWDW
jgi:hypothetical protein